MARRRLVGLLVAALALGGCGGSAGSTASAQPTLGATPSSPAVLSDADDEAAGPITSEAPGSLVAIDGASRLPGEPDPGLTPGALNPDVTQATIDATICVAHWTDGVRPSSSLTNKLKASGIAAYGYSDTSLGSYEEDHLIPLQLGGAPTDPRNLWPQPWIASLPDGRATGARTKDAYETALKHKVCDRDITLAAAQELIGIHWVHAYYGIALGSLPTPPAPASGSAAASASATPVVTVLAISFTALPDPAIAGSSALIRIRTAPGAICGIAVTYASGAISGAAGLASAATADAGGDAEWSWKVSPSTTKGLASARVGCSRGSTTASAVTSFEVR